MGENNISEWYRRVSDLIGRSQERGDFIYSNLDYIGSIFGETNINEDDIYRLKVENQAEATSVAMFTYHKLYSPILLKTVSELQKYISKYYVSVDNFLGEHGLIVSLSFSKISEASGFPISSQHVDNIS